MRAYDLSANPLPIINSAPILEEIFFRALSFIINPVKGGSPPPLIKESKKFLEGVCIKITIGANTIKYITTNHNNILPDKVKIQPICTIPEKITINSGLLMLSMMAAEIQTFMTLSIDLDKNTITIKEIGAIFCQV